MTEKKIMSDYRFLAREVTVPHRVFSLNEAAEYLHLPPTNIEQLVRQKEIPFEQKGKRIVFRKIDMDAWASRRILGLSDKKLTDYHKATSARANNTADGRSIISDLTKLSAIKTDLTSRTKPSLLRDMVALADKSGLILNAKDLIQSLELRESLCSTALADGFALLHPRHHEAYIFEESFIAFGRTIRAIPFGASDGKETDIFFLICCLNDRLHLHVLARLCLMCRDKKFLLRLRQAAVPEDAHKCLRLQELETAKQISASPGR